MAKTYDACVVDLCGYEAHLLPDRALYLPHWRAVLVADVHLGKGAWLRRQGIAVPGGASLRDLERLSELVRITTARRLIILGDFFHHRPDPDEPVSRSWAAWRAGLPCVQMDLVDGNHDRHARQCSLAGLDRHAESLLLGPFRLCHEPVAKEGHYVLAGHVHPVVTLRASGDRLRVPVFHFGKEVGVLPAFGSLTGGHEIRPRAGERVYLVGDQVVPLPAKGVVNQV